MALKKDAFDTVITETTKLLLQNPDSDYVFNYKFKFIKLELHDSNKFNIHSGSQMSKEAFFNTVATNLLDYIQWKILRIRISDFAHYVMSVLVSLIALDLLITTATNNKTTFTLSDSNGRIEKVGFSLVTPGTFAANRAETMVYLDADTKPAVAIIISYKYLPTPDYKNTAYLDLYINLNTITTPKFAGCYGLSNTKMSELTINNLQKNLFDRIKEF